MSVVPRDMADRMRRDYARRGIVIQEPPDPEERERFTRELVEAIRRALERQPEWK